MNKEDILSNLLKKCVGWTFRSDDADEVLEIYKHEVKATERLQQENKKYKEVIDKLKEEINNNMHAFEDEGDIVVDCCCDGFKLLDILKEVE